MQKNQRTGFRRFPEVVFLHTLMFTLFTFFMHFEPTFWTLFHQEWLIYIKLYGTTNKNLINFSFLYAQVERTMAHLISGSKNYGPHKLEFNWSKFSTWKCVLKQNGSEHPYIFAYISDNIWPHDINNTILDMGRHS